MKSLSFSVLFILGACASDYKGLQSTTAPDCSKVLPAFGTAWYSAKVDVIGKHLSGLLLVKPVDSTYRIVFTNEAGVTFFDLSFSANGGFTPVRVIPQLNKKAVVELLREDFDLMLGLPFRRSKLTAFSRGNELFFGVAEKSETAYFITDPDCASLQRLELGSARKKKVTITSTGDPRRPQKIVIKQHNFDMMITLDLIERNVTE